MAKETSFFQNLGKLDCLSLFIEYESQLEKEEHAREKRDEQERGIKSRKVRENFRDLLQEYKEGHRITPKLRWREFRGLIKDDDRYLAMLGDVDGSTPAELYYDVLDELVERIESQTRHLIKLAKENNIEDVENIEIDQLRNIITQSNLREYDNANFEVLADLQDKIKKQTLKEKRKAKKRFLHELNRTRITRSSTWQQIRNIFREESKQSLFILNEEELKVLFNEHTKKLAIDNAFDSSEEEGEFSDDSPRDKKKKRRNSYSSSPDSRKKDSSSELKRRDRKGHETEDDEKDSRYKRRKENY